MLTVPTAARSTPETADSRPWRWSQHWRNVFFAHWHVPAETLLPLLPPGLELDTWDGLPWVSAVAFRLESVRPRWLPPLGPASNFLELNLRIYVRHQGEPAVFFISMHGSSRLAVFLARRLTPLPYAIANIDYLDTGPNSRFEAFPSLFSATFSCKDSGPARPLSEHSLDAWLLERYRAFVTRNNRVYRMVVRHPAWQVREVTAKVAAAGLGEPRGLDLGHAPDCCHFSPGVWARVDPFDVV